MRSGSKPSKRSRSTSIESSTRLRTASTPSLPRRSGNWWTRPCTTTISRLSSIPRRRSRGSGMSLSKMSSTVSSPVSKHRLGSCLRSASRKSRRSCRTLERGGRRTTTASRSSTRSEAVPRTDLGMIYQRLPIGQSGLRRCPRSS